MTQRTSYVVVNTHKGLFHYSRLPYEASGIFQRVMECLLRGFRGILGVIVYLKDIVITGSSVEHFTTLDKLLQKLRDAGPKIKQNMCAFLAPSGHCIDAQGLHPFEEKMKAVEEHQYPRMSQNWNLNVIILSS